MLRIFLILLFTAVSINAISISKRAYCGGGDAYLTTNGQVISSHAGMAHGHNYGRNMDCVWKIEAPEGMKVELVAKSFDVEDDSLASCDYDYVILYDGPDTTSSTIGKFCGTTFNPITSTGRHLTLRFITDNSTQRGGFEIYYNFTTISVGCDSNEYDCKDTNGCIPKSWLCDDDDDCDNGSDELPNSCNAVLHDSRCGATNLTGTHGDIASPNFPHRYPTGIHCVYTIQAPAGTKHILFTFDDDFHLEPDSSCANDYVLIYNKSFKSGPYCGTVSSASFTMPGDRAHVEFMSDYSKAYDGYRLIWRALQ